MRLSLCIALGVAVFSIARVASAGGMNMPDNGTEALGRGGAFTAKADDPTAIYYNIAGLARQRGTRLLVNANMAHGSMDFQRSGTYQGDPATQPYVGKPYPLAQSQDGIATIPFIAATSDFGLENATFALGTFAPPATTARAFTQNIDGLPSPTRYSSLGGGPSSFILWHTAAGAFRVGDWLELGIAAHVAQISIGQRLLMNQASLCTKAEDPSCDALADAKVTGWSGTGSVGAMVHPSDSLSIGLNVMGPTRILAEGNVKIKAPSKAPITIPDTRAALGMSMPAIVRAGVRKAFGEHDGKRTSATTGDLELDATYEFWGVAMNPGPVFAAESIPLHKGPLVTTSDRFWQNTISVRAGGSVTPELSVPVTFRAGAYFDQSATASATTNVGTDTLDKFALTVGAGFRFNSWRLDLAYASVFDISRTVADGTTKSSSDKGAAVINNGDYSGHTHIVSLGATIELDVLFRGTTLPSIKRGEQSQVATR